MPYSCCIRLAAAAAAKAGGSDQLLMGLFFFFFVEMLKAPWMNHNPSLQLTGLNIYRKGNLFALLSLGILLSLLLGMTETPKFI